MKRMISSRFYVLVVAVWKTKRAKKCKVGWRIFIADSTPAGRSDVGWSGEDEGLGVMRDETYLCCVGLFVLRQG